MQGGGVVTIYTGTGDAGETSLGDGTRVPKTSRRVEAYGTIDEANSFVGLARARIADERLGSILLFLQQRLMNCASSLSLSRAREGGTRSGIDPADVIALEHAIDTLSAGVGPLGGFVVPGGGETAARLHVARTVLRRAERRVHALAAEDQIDPEVLAFLNRGSDLLFAAARYAATLEREDEERWDPRAVSPKP
jgi:cob(I)alamin adenosyltransferase